MTHTQNYGDSSKKFKMMIIIIIMAISCTEIKIRKRKYSYFFLVFQGNQQNNSKEYTKTAYLTVPEVLVIQII